MTDITSKIRKKNDTFPKPLKINKKLIYFAEQIANEFNFLQKSRSRTCGNNFTDLNKSQNIWYLSMNLSATLIGKHEFEKSFKSFHDGGPYNIKSSPM